MITDFFDAQNGIVLATLTGKIFMEDILQWFSTLTPERFPVKDYKMLSDATKAEYAFSFQDLHESDKAIADLSSRFYRVKVAVVHSKPLQQAYSEIIVEKNRIGNYNQKTFSVKETAMEWLLKA